MKEMKVLLTVEVASLAALVAAWAVAPEIAVEIGAGLLALVAAWAVWVLARTIKAAAWGE